MNIRFSSARRSAAVDAEIDKRNRVLIDDAHPGGSFDAPLSLAIGLTAASRPPSAGLFHVWGID